MNITILIIIISVIIAFVIIKSKSKKSKPTSNKTWQNNYSPGMSSAAIVPQGSGWYFNFPTNPNSHVHYIQWFKPPILTVGKTLYAKFSITGGQFIPQEFPDRIATVCLLIQRKGDDWSAQGKYQSYRWYSSKIINLTEGTFELSIPLNVTEWGDILGGHDATLFTQALQNVENVGLVFGSAGGRGHGVYAKQVSRFTLLQMNII